MTTETPKIITDTNLADRFTGGHNLNPSIIVPGNDLEEDTNTITGESATKYSYKELEEIFSQSPIDLAKFVIYQADYVGDTAEYFFTSIIDLYIKKYSKMATPQRIKNKFKKYNLEVHNQMNIKASNTTDMVYVEKFHTSASVIFWLGNCPGVCEKRDIVRAYYHALLAYLARLTNQNGVMLDTIREELIEKIDKGEITDNDLSGDNKCREMAGLNIASVKTEIGTIEKEYLKELEDEWDLLKEKGSDNKKEKAKYKALTVRLYYLMTGNSKRVDKGLKYILEAAELDYLDAQHFLVRYYMPNYNSVGLDGELLSDDDKMVQLRMWMNRLGKINFSEIAEFMKKLDDEEDEKTKAS